MTSPGGWIGEGGVQLPAKALMALAQQDAADRAEEKQRRLEREARAEVRQQGALRQAMLRDQALGIMRTPEEILAQEGQGRPLADVFAEANERMEREDAKARRQAWLAGVGEAPEVITLPSQAPAAASAGKPRVPVRLKIRQALTKMGKGK